MKKGVLFIFLFSILFANKIEVINGIYKQIDFNQLKRYSKNVITKSSFDSKKHKYTFVFLEKIRDIYCPFSNKITICAYDEYNITFNINEIKNKNIIFTFEQDGKPISIENKGPAKIIYTKNKNPLKEIFLINKIICN